MRIRLIAGILLLTCRLAPAAMAQSIVAPPETSPGAPDHLTITLLHTNDLHGHILPFAYTETGRGEKTEQPSVGGAARRATLIRRLRGEIQNPVMLIDSGDTFTRGPLTNAYEGIADIEAMNAVGYEAAAIGNNEFKAKDAVDRNDAAGAQAALLLVIKRSRFPWLCANATDQKGAFLEGVQPYIVRQFDGVRVGFLGLTTPRSAAYPQVKGWTITDPIAAAKEWIPKARAHCDILIAVTHIGVEMDNQLAAQTSGLDAIVGGDSHTFLYKAMDVRNAQGRLIPIVQDGEFGVDLGRFDLNLARESDGWHLASYRYALLPVRPPLPEASDVAAVIRPYVRPLQTVAGRLASVAETPGGRTRQTTQIVADALRDSEHADLALATDNLYDAFHHREVTRYDIYAALPFHDDAVTADMTGAELRALPIDKATTALSGDFAHLDPVKTYRIALVDFDATSAFHISGARLRETGRDVRDDVIAYFGSHKEVH